MSTQPQPAAPALPVVAGGAPHGSTDPNVRPAMVRPTSPEAVPKDLRERRNWVLWRWEWNGKTWTKVPYTITGKNADSTNPATWGEFPDVWAAADRSPQSGIGFMFSAEDHITGIDFDNCLNPDGTLKDWARPYIEKLAFGYIEVSPSRTGVKAFVMADLAAIRGVSRGCRAPLGDGEVELYDRKRFFTVTGLCFNGAPLEIEENAATVRRLLRKLGKLKPKSQPIADVPPPTEWRTVTDAERDQIRTILDVARVNAGNAVLNDLMSGGAAYYPGRDGRPDDSRADAAFYHLLALLFERDPARMYAAFMMTPRGARAKARRADYHERTIRFVLTGSPEREAA